MAVSFTVSTKMLPFKRLSWLWIVFQIVVVVNVNPLVSRRGEYKEYVHCISVECRRIFSARFFSKNNVSKATFFTLHSSTLPFKPRIS